MNSQGRYKVVCDRSGFVFWDHETTVEWNGLRVAKRFSEARHPQDFVRGVTDDQSVKNPRPEAADTFLAPGDVTAADL